MENENQVSEQNKMTEATFKRLEEKIDHLEKVERPRIIEEIQTARAHGDLSENSEYDAAREAQRLNEEQIANLRYQLAHATIVTGGGNTVSLEDEVQFEAANGAKKTVTVVSTTEADVLQSKISNVSPLGMALMDHGVGDEVSYTVPSGKVLTVKILSITHPNQDAE